MSAPVPVAPRESARPAGAGGFDSVADVVVVGGGGAGLPAALFARWLGDEVVVLEKAPELGGTARKAAYWYWVPNNAAMRAAGTPDPEEDFLRYVARLARPHQYDPASPTLGLSQWEHDMCRAIYESASPATELLKEKGALDYRHCAGVPDYWAELPQDKAPTGRVLVPAGARETMSDGGQVGIAQLVGAAAARRGRPAHRAPRPAGDHRRRRRRRGGGVHTGRLDGPGRRPQGGHLRHRRLHPRPGAAAELPQRARVRRLRGGHERGRLRPHRLARSAPSCAT